MTKNNELPYCPNDHPYLDEEVDLKTVADLCRALNGLPDDMEVYFFGCPLDTVYNLSVCAKRQECIEHSGYRHTAEGLIFQLTG